MAKYEYDIYRVEKIVSCWMRVLQQSKSKKMTQCDWRDGKTTMDLEKDTEGKAVDEVKKFGDQLRIKKPWEAKNLREGGYLELYQGIASSELEVWIETKEIKEDIKGEPTEK